MLSTSQDGNLGALTGALTIDGGNWQGTVPNFTTTTRPISLPAPVALPAGKVSPGAGGDFRSILAGAVGQVEAAQTGAGKAVASFLAGEGAELHTTALATQRAELSMEMFLQTRNKIVNAYQEIMRMQL